MKLPKPRRLSSGNYFIQLRLGGESVPVTAPTASECTKQAALIKAEHMNGRRVSGTDITLTAAIDAYIDVRRNILSPATIAGYLAIKRNRFKQYISRPMKDFTPELCRVMCNAEAKQCSPKYLRNAWCLINAVIKDATGRAITITLPQVVKADKAYLDSEQLFSFMAAIQGTSAEIGALLALNSLRRSEIFAMTWDNIDIKNGFINVSGAAVYNERHELVVKSANKNASSKRRIPILIPQLHEALKAVEHKEGKVVTIMPDGLYKAINRTCAKIELPQVGIHGLRHSFASLAYHLGVPEKIAMELGGWADDSTMRRIYTHIAQSDITHYGTKFRDYFSNNAN